MQCKILHLSKVQNKALHSKVWYKAYNSVHHSNTVQSEHLEDTWHKKPLYNCKNLSQANTSCPWLLTIKQSKVKKFSQNGSFSDQIKQVSGFEANFKMTLKA